MTISKEKPGVVCASERIHTFRLLETIDAFNNTCRLTHIDVVILQQPRLAKATVHAPNLEFHISSFKNEEVSAPLAACSRSRAVAPPWYSWPVRTKPQIRC